MMEVKNYITLPEIVPPGDLKAWRDNITKVCIADCPPEVVEFIEALAAKLDDFVQIRKFHILISGYDLLLGGLKEVNGEAINPWDIYPTPVPYMIAADHRAWMYRLFKRKGKEGLISFCKVKVKGTELERLLDVLNVHVFYQVNPEFKRVMEKIMASKKMESRFD